MSNSTKIQFIFIGNTTPKFRIKLSVTKIIHHFNHGNVINISNEIFINNKYIESFDIFEEDTKKQIYNFRMSIYEKITNYIYYDTTKNGLSSIEVIFFGKNNLPNQINYGGINLSEFNNNLNKYRKRICIANINPYDLEYLNDETFKQKNFIFKKDSYQIIIRFAHNNTIKYSVSNISFQNYIYSDDNIYNEFSSALYSDINIENTGENKESLIEKNSDENTWINKKEIESLEKFYSDYINFLDNLHKNESLKEQDVHNILSNDLQCLNDNYNEIRNKKIFQYLQDTFVLSDIQNDFNYINYYFILNEYKSIYNNENTLFNFFRLSKNAIATNSAINELIFKLYSDKSLELSDKTKLLKASSEICIKSILSKNSVTEIDYIFIENIKNKNNNHPYLKAVELITNIIDHLDEDSRLFEAFLYFNSGTIENQLEEDKKMNYTEKNSLGEIIRSNFAKYKTEFGLSLLNIEQVKSHLRKLIPKFFIRIHTPVNFRAYYSKETNLMVLNEEVMFNESLYTLNFLFERNDSDKYIIPIAMEILHEMMSHGKIRVFNKEENSPRYFRDSKNDFEYKSIIKMCELKSNKKEKIPIPESGKILEYFISDNPRIINILKTPVKENIKFIDYKYWIGKNFDNLENEILQRESEQNFVGTKMLFDESEEDYIDDCYIDRGKSYII